MDIIEGHPIPQDITGFQFRLIGDMTVKQFAYLAVGLVIGWFVFLFPVAFIFKVLLAAMPVLTGVILAFVPIQGVAADTMLGLFFRALLRPNQYMYRKTGKDFTDTTPEKPASQTIKKIQVPPLTPAVQKTRTEPVIPEKSIIQPAQSLLPAVQQPPVPQISIPLEKQLQDALAQKKILEQQLQQLQTLQPQPAPPQLTMASTKQPGQAAPSQSHVKKITDQPKKTGIAPFMPDVPNLIAGVIKDSRGNILPNILVEVKDKDDNPVRAFKTNALGQFASATPLLSSTYTITFEDPKKTQRFDTIELSVNGEILPPLEITSIDEREDLRKQLFENK